MVPKLVASWKSAAYEEDRADPKRTRKMRRTLLEFEFFRENIFSVSKGLTREDTRRKGKKK